MSSINLLLKPLRCKYSLSIELQRLPNAVQRNIQPSSSVLGLLVEKSLLTAYTHTAWSMFDDSVLNSSPKQFVSFLVVKFMCVHVLCCILLCTELPTATDCELWWFQLKAKLSGTKLCCQSASRQIRNIAKHWHLIRFYLLRLFYRLTQILISTLFAAEETSILFQRRPNICEAQYITAEGDAFAKYFRSMFMMCLKIIIRDFNLAPWETFHSNGFCIKIKSCFD